MKDTNYAYCVARLRANETKMLGSEQVVKLAHCKNVDEAIDMLYSFGWTETKGSVKDVISEQSKALWQLLSESVPDKKELEVLCVLNDFFNIKAAVKCHFTTENPFKYYVYPSTFDLNELTDKINSHDFSSLSGDIGTTAEKAYETACLTENGQSAEIIIDRGAIDCLCEYSKAKKSGLINEVCAFLCDTANIKIAVRINALKKSRDFAEAAIGNCSALDRKTLIELSLSDKENLSDYLMNSKYKEGVLLFEENSALYEKWCDDSLIKLLSRAKYTAFGFDPVCVYYFAKQNEIKTVRIVLNAVASGLDPETIKERVRLLYV